MSTETYSASLSLCDRLSGRPEIIPLSISALQHSLIKGCKSVNVHAADRELRLRALYESLCCEPFLLFINTLYPFPSFFYTFLLNVFPLLVFLPALTEEFW